MSRLRSLQILSPCQEEWGKMEGDLKKRFCERCQHTVNDLTEMTESEAEATLAAGPLCVRVTRDQNGDVLTRTTLHKGLLEVLQAYASKRR